MDEEQKVDETLTLKRDLENAEREIVMNQEQQGLLEKKKSFLLRDIEIVTNQARIALSQWEFLKPNWKYEQDPEYLEWARKYFQLSLEKRLFEFDNQLSQINNLIQSVTEQRESVEKHTQYLKEKISEVENNG